MRLSPASQLGAALLLLLLLCLEECWAASHGSNTTTGFYYQSGCPNFGNGTSSCSHSVLMLNGAVYHPPAPAHRRGGLKPEGNPATYNPGDIPMLDAVDIKSAYGIPYQGVAAGITVGVVLWCDSLTVETDLATYRTANGLPACTTINGCFRKLNQAGLPAPAPIGVGCNAADTAAAQDEISLDVQMVSAVCPSCNILLVLANSAFHPDTNAAIQTAVAQGARVVSMSYGAPEEAVEPAFFAAGKAGGVGFFAASGDDGFNQLPPTRNALGNIIALNLGVQRPASFPNVMAIGGTVLTVAANARKWSESAWVDAGSGCSAFYPNPNAAVNTGCGALRALTDVSAVAANMRIVSGGLWTVVAGTSVSTPIVASIFALTGNGGVPSNWPYTHTTLFLDITAGATDVPNPTFPVPPNEFGVPGTCPPTALLCNAVVGYDGPTGIGVWFPVAPTCGAFACPANFANQPATTVCASLAGCTQAECCTAIPCAATVAPVGYTGNCAAGLTCLGVVCAAGFAGLPTATCTAPPGPFTYAGCLPQVCVATVAPVGYLGNCAAGLACGGVVCAPGFVGFATATCLTPPGPFAYAGCVPAGAGSKSNPALLGLLALLVIPIAICALAALSVLRKPATPCPCPGMMAAPGFYPA